MVLAATGNYKNINLISGYTSHDGAEMLGNEQYLLMCIIQLINSLYYGQGRSMFHHFTYFLLLDDSFMYVSLTANIKEGNAESYIIEHFDEVAPNILDYREDDDVPVYLTRRTFEYFTGGPYLEPDDDFVKVKGLLIYHGKHCTVLKRGKKKQDFVTNVLALECCMTSWHHFSSPEEGLAVLFLGKGITRIVTTRHVSWY